MTPDAIRSALFAEVSALAAAGTLYVAWPNQAANPPADAIWLRPTLKTGLAIEGEIGVDGLGIRAGVLMVSIFAPIGSGTTDALAIAGTVESIFRRRIIGGVDCSEPYTMDIGDDSQGFYHISVTVPFQAWTGEQ